MLKGLSKEERMELMAGLAADAIVYRKNTKQNTAKMRNEQPQKYQAKYHKKYQANSSHFK